MLNRLKNLLRWARVTKSGNDDQFFPIQQVEYMGKTVNCMMVFPYGMHANMTEDSLIVMMAIQGHEENRAGIGGTPTNRPKLAAGEVAYYHPLTGTIIHLRASGDIDIDTGSANVNVNTVNANITASEMVKLDTPETLITGNVLINGGLTVDGATALSGTVTSNGKDISDTHTHSQGTDSAGNSQANTDGVL